MHTNFSLVLRMLKYVLTRTFFYLGVCIAQNGPGITNFVTGVAAAYWAHSPVVVITPETGSLTNGLGGFQETNQVCTYHSIGFWVFLSKIVHNL